MVWSASSQYKMARVSLTARAMAMSLMAIRVSATSVRKNHDNLTHCKPRSVSPAAAKLAEDSVAVMGIATAMAVHPASGAQTVLGWAPAWDSAVAVAEIPFLTSAFCVAAG
jgi:hypothetical protein